MRKWLIMWLFKTWNSGDWNKYSLIGELVKTYLKTAHLSRNPIRKGKGSRAGIIAALVGLILLTGVAMADDNCITVISNNYESWCIDGYEWLVKYEKSGCMTSRVPVAQKFSIYPKTNGKPKMSLPVPCTVEE